MLVDYMESAGSDRAAFAYIAKLEGLCLKAADYITTAADLIAEDGGDEGDDADARSFARELRETARGKRAASSSSNGHKERP